MNKKELALILQEGESLTIEFKENVNTDLSKELFSIIFKRTTQEISREQAINSQEPGKTTQETTQEPRNTTQEKILSLIKINPHITRNELATKVAITPDGVKYHLRNLTKMGVLQHIGATRKGYWQIIEKDN